MTERELQDAIVDLAHLLQYRCAHFRNARTGSGNHITPVAYDAKGFPDLVLVGRGRVIYAELKSARGVVSPEQQAWLESLERAGQESFIWRPKHWLSGDVERVLKHA